MMWREKLSEEWRDMSPLKRALWIIIPIALVLLYLWVAGKP
jgi:hypothetical protein